MSLLRESKHLRGPFLNGARAIGGQIVFVWITEMSEFAQITLRLVHALRSAHRKGGRQVHRMSRG
jgi:hypothetical protein